MRLLSPVARLVMVLCLAACAAGMARGQCAEDWRLGPESAFPGVIGEVNAMVVHDDGRGSALYIGGDFTVAGAAMARSIVRWDGKTWEAVEGLEGTVVALASYQGELYAGSDDYEFDLPGTPGSHGIAKHGPGGWQFLSGVMNGRVNALQVHQGLLYVGGSFSSPVSPSVGDDLIAWNGSAWVRVVSDITPTVQALTVWNDKIVAGGDGTFGTVGSPRSEYVALLNGTRWASLGGGTDRAVSALTVYNGELIAGGYFQTAGGSAINHVARWDGVSWKAFGTGLTGTSGDVWSLSVHDGQLFVGGDLSGGVADTRSYLVRWDGSGWHSEMTYAAQSAAGRRGVLSMVSLDDRLLMGGSFDRLGSVYAPSLAQLRDGSLELATGGLDFPVHQLYADGEDVLAVGDFLLSTGARGVARLVEDGADGAHWAMLPGAFSAAANAVIRHGGGLVVGGTFTEVDGLTVNRIARQGAAGGWEAMGEGFTGAVGDLIEFRGELIASGSFTASGTTAVNRIARWDGSAWQPLGEGLGGTVSALAVHHDELIAAGLFTTAGGVPVVNVAAWDGTAWRAMGTELDEDRVDSLAVFEGSLIAGGRFYRAGAGELRRVARWDGSAWRPMGEGITSWGSIDVSVSALAVHRGALIAGGYWGVRGTSSNDFLWRWDGSAWVGMSSVGFLLGGPRPIVGVGIRSLLPRGGELLVGGLFTSVGATDTLNPGEVASYFARWGCAPCVADMDGDGVVDFADYLTFLNLFDAQDPRADLNGDGIVDFPDYLEFLNAFSSGCA